MPPIIPKSIESAFGPETWILRLFSIPTCYTKDAKSLEKLVLSQLFFHEITFGLLKWLVICNGWRSLFRGVDDIEGACIRLICLFDNISRIYSS